MKGRGKGRDRKAFFFLDVRHFTLHVRAHVQGVDRGNEVQPFIAGCFITENSDGNERTD